MSDSLEKKSRSTEGGDTVQSALARAVKAVTGDPMAGFAGIAKMYRLPKIEPMKPEKYTLRPMEEIHGYASAGELLKSLDRYYQGWKETVEEGLQVAIYAMLSNGSLIQVQNLREEGYNGIGIEGLLNDLPCLILQHQASLQFICVAEKLEEPQPPREIGFIFAKR